MRDLTVAGSTAGAELVSPTQALRIGVPGAANSLTSLCTVVTPGVNAGAMRIGKFLAQPTVYVLPNEGASIPEVTPSIGQSLMTSTNSTVYLEEYRQLASQSEGGAKAIALLETNALKGHAGAQIIAGSGSNGEGLGLVDDTTIPSASGATLAWSTVRSTMRAVEAYVGDAPLAWAVTAPAATLLRQAQNSGGSAILVDGKIGGDPTVIVGGTSAAHSCFGKWSDLLVFQWLPIELSVSPYANFKAAILGVRAWLTSALAPLVATSFATIKDIT